MKERVKLTMAFCNSQKPSVKIIQKGKNKGQLIPTFYKDSEFPGMWLKVEPTGHKSFVFSHRPKGKSKKFINYSSRKCSLGAKY